MEVMKQRGHTSRPLVRLTRRSDETFQQNLSVEALTVARARSMLTACSKSVSPVDFRLCLLLAATI